MALLFKKLFSKSGDLLTKEYPEKVGSDLEVSVDRTFKSTNGDNEVKVTLKKEPCCNDVVVTLEPKGKINRGDLEYEIAGKVSNSGKSESTVTISKLADGKAKVTIKESFEGRLEKYNVEIGTEYVDTKFSANGSLNFAGEKLIQNIKGKLALVYSDDGLAVGIELAGQKKGDEFTLDTTTVRTEQTSGNYVASFEAKFAEQNALKIGLYQKVNNNLEAATDFEVSNANNGGLDSNLRVGFISQLNENSSLRTRLSLKNSVNQRLSLVYKQKYANNFSLQLGADLNTTQILGGNVAAEDRHAFNLTLSLD